MLQFLLQAGCDFLHEFKCLCRRPAEGKSREIFYQAAVCQRRLGRQRVGFDEQPAMQVEQSEMNGPCGFPVAAECSIVKLLHQLWRDVGGYRNGADASTCHYRQIERVFARKQSEAFR